MKNSPHRPDEHTHNMMKKTLLPDLIKNSPARPNEHTPDRPDEEHTPARPDEEVWLRMHS